MLRTGIPTKGLSGLKNGKNLQTGTPTKGLSGLDILYKKKRNS